MPGCWTLPWTTAMSTVSSAFVGTGTARPARVTAAASPNASRAGTARRSDPLPRSPQRVAAQAASRAPASATAKVTSGAPPSAASGVNGEPVLAKASRPQGKPPNGSRSRAHSSATHRQAAHSGPPGSREVTASAAPSSAAKSASDHREADHRVPADDMQPLQQDQEERQPEGKARPGTLAGGPAAGQQRQRGDGHQGQRPQVVRREGQTERDAEDGRKAGARRLPADQSGEPPGAPGARRHGAGARLRAGHLAVGRGAADGFFGGVGTRWHGRGPSLQVVRW